MKEQELLGHLLDLARRLDFEVRTDQGPFRDGSCRLVGLASAETSLQDPLAEDRRIILLNRNSPTHRRISALGRALSECSLEGIFLLPAVREVIEKASQAPPQDSSTNADSSEVILD